LLTVEQSMDPRTNINETFNEFRVTLNKKFIIIILWAIYQPVLEHVSFVPFLSCTYTQESFLIDISIIHFIKYIIRSKKSLTINLTKSLIKIDNLSQ